MKKTNILLAFTAGLGLFSLFSSCDFELPSSVSVKTDATYNFSIGDIEHDFNDSFDKDTLFDSLDTGAPDSPKVFDYFPGQENDKLQEFLLVVKVSDISFSFPTGQTPGTQIPTDLTADTVPGLAGTVPVNLELNKIFDAFDVLGTQFKEKAEFFKIPVYIYCNIGSGFSKMNLKGKFKVENENDSSKYEWIIGDVNETDPTKAELVYLSLFQTPTLLNPSGKEAESGDVVVTDVSKLQASARDDSHMTSFINKCKNEAGGIKISYELAIYKDGTEFDGNDIDDLSIYLILGLPFKFNVHSENGSNLEIDIKKLANNDSDESEDTDIFKRTEVTDISKFDKYLDAIESIVLGYKTLNNPFVSDASSFVIESEWPDIEKELEMNADEVKLTCEELRRMLLKYPYNPSALLVIPNDSSFAIGRDISLKMNMYIAIDTDGKIEF